MSAVFSWREAPVGDFAVIGDPVAHSLSPKMHAAAYRTLGLPYRYHAIRVPTGEVALALDHLTSLGYRGVNVTIPHKEEVLAWALKVDPLAYRVRAANTLRLEDRACINTDAPGFIDTLEPFSNAPRTALLLGAGGSARAIAVALLNSGFELFLYNRTLSKAVDLAVELDMEPTRVRDKADPTGVAFIVNTTSASLNNEEIPLLWDQSEPGALAYDLMYSKEPTLFLQAAARHGISGIDGRNLLAAQGARSFEWWLDIKAPRTVMLEAIQ